MNGTERRWLQRAPQLRKRADGATILEGYAAVFYRANDPGSEYWLWPDLVERIMPSAFTAGVASDDVRALKNHDANLLLGRRQPAAASNTLSLSVDETGLRYEVELPDTSCGRDLAVEIQRGDITGSSFGFRLGSLAKRGKVVWSQQSLDGKLIEIREIHDLELLDVSPVTYPAYESTTVAVRNSRETIEAERLAFRRDLASKRLRPGEYLRGLGLLARHLSSPRAYG